MLYNKESRRLGKHPHIEVSAKERTNIGELFQMVLTKVVDMRYQMKREKEKEKEVVLRMDQIVVKRNCCGG